MKFDWSVNVGTLLNVVLLVGAIAMAAFRFNTGLKTALTEIRTSIDLIAKRVHLMEEWVKSATSDSLRSTEKIQDLKTAVNRLEYISGVLERRAERLEGRKDWNEHA